MNFKAHILDDLGILSVHSGDIVIARSEIPRERTKCIVGQELATTGTASKALEAPALGSWGSFHHSSP